MKWRKRKKKEEDQLKKHQEELQSRYNNVDKRHPGIFTLLKSSQKIMCQYCLTQVSIFPERGDLLQNIHAHVTTDRHITCAKKGMQQKTVTGYFLTKQ